MFAARKYQNARYHSVISAIQYQKNDSFSRYPKLTPLKNRTRLGLAGWPFLRKQHHKGTDCAGPLVHLPVDYKNYEIALEHNGDYANQLICLVILKYASENII